MGAFVCADCECPAALSYISLRIRFHTLVIFSVLHQLLSFGSGDHVLGPTGRRGDAVFVGLSRLSKITLQCSRALEACSLAREADPWTFVANGRKEGSSSSSSIVVVVVVAVVVVVVLAVVVVVVVVVVLSVKY